MQNAAVQQHYNSRAENDVVERRKSPAFAARSANNWVKSMLLEQYIRPGGRVLDLCAGRGGDLVKMQRHGAAEVVSVDISSQEVQRARERWTEISSKKPDSNMSALFLCADVFSSSSDLIEHIKTVRASSASQQPPSQPVYVNGVAHSKDVFGQRHCKKSENTAFCSAPLPPQEPLPPPLFDTVTCQFALHYAFENAERLENFARTVSQMLQPGGKLLCTFPDAERIVALCWPPAPFSPHEQRQGGHGTYTDSLLHLQFDPQLVANNATPNQLPLFNAKYWFTLRESITNCPENLVHMPTLASTMTRYHLIPEHSSTFDVYCNELMQANPSACRAFEKMVSHVLDDAQWRVVSLYRVAVFCRQ